MGKARELFTVSSFQIAFIQSLRNKTNRKMMASHFRGYNNLVITMTTTTFTFFIFLFFFLVVVAERENPLVELSSMEELVLEAGYGEERLSTVLVGGTLLCDACLDSNSTPLPHPVPGASLVVSCHTGEKRKKSNWVRGTTDENGDFLIDLPSHFHAIPNLEKICLVRVLHLPKSSLCHPVFTSKHKAMKLSSIGEGVRTYTTQSIHLTPRSLEACGGGRKDEAIHTD